jgi:aldehyde dehydrogenase (NAD+)
MGLALTDFDGLFIGGRWMATAASDDVINPATEEVLARAPLGGAAETDLAIAAARAAFDEGRWPRMAPRERAAALQRLLDVLTAWAPDIAALTVVEVGTSVATARAGQVDVPLQHLAWFVELAARFDPVTPLPTTLFTGRRGRVLGAGVRHRDAAGVVGAITPFNAPFFLNLLKVGPALAAGCTMVLKPSPFTPFSALLLGRAAQEADLPPGVLNIVTGDVGVGQQLVTDPRVDVVTFTGSDAVGSQILAQAAPGLKKVLLELGGKSAMIVRSDGDVNAAAAAGVGSFVTFAGQGCAIHTRHLVHRSVYEEYVAAATHVLAQVTVGDPSDPATIVGPLIRDAQRSRVEHYVDSARSDGFPVVAGGRRPAGLDRGFYYEPTLIRDVSNSSVVAQEEIFGPVAVVIPFDTDDEAVSLANDSRYGLSGSLWSADVAGAYDMALRLRTGNVSLNGGTGGMSSAAPFGGYKRSGLGRELGADALEDYLETKAIQFHAG